MTALIPTSQPTAVETYEDMFKEITRKLYGEESGLYPHNTQVAQVAQLASGTPAAPEGGERSFTTLVSDRSLTQIDYETTTVNTGGDQQAGTGQGNQQQPQQTTFKTEDHLTTAFGLAALMQNGFPPPGAILNPVNFPTKTTGTNITIATGDDRWQQNQQVQTQEQQPVQPEQTWNTGKHSSTTTNFTQKGFKKPKIEPQDISPTNNGTNSGSTLNIPQTGTDKKGNFNSAAIGAATGKRYSCSSCPYTTDRRDLFTRHENIHKEEKPFHCYACLKQFNRADHVKKHFLRMHRDMEYEIAKTRKTVSTKCYYNSSSNSGPSNTTNIATNTSTTVSVPAPQLPVSQPQTIQVNTINIPTASFPTQITIPSHHVATTVLEHVTASTINSHDMSTLNGTTIIGHHQQQQQQQQPQQPTQIVLATASGPPTTVTIKQEKGVVNNVITVSNVPPSLPNRVIESSGAVNTMVDEKPFAKKSGAKGEKRFSCCYCPWSGADNWGLKRHLNTHTKPFVCMLCDYKAARSERLATHVFKVHNKKACNKCNYFAEDQAQLNAHQIEAHLLNMQAIGRNKASVTQDFHNAGGGNHLFNPQQEQQQHQLASNGNSNSSFSSSSTNKLSLLVAASSSASCSPSSSPPPSQQPSPPVEPRVVAKMEPQATGNGLTEEHLSLLQLLATAAVAQQHLQLQQQQQQQKATSLLTSPPASHTTNSHHLYHHHQNQTSSTNSSSSLAHAVGESKRRRKSSSRYDKENKIIHRGSSIPGQQKTIDLSAVGGTTVENGIERNNNHSNSSNNNNSSSVNNKNISETIFDKVYKKSYSKILASGVAFCKPTVPAEKDVRGKQQESDEEGKENFNLAEFLRNHREVTISTLSTNAKSSVDDEVILINEDQRIGTGGNRMQPRKLASDLEPNASPNNNVNNHATPPEQEQVTATDITDIRDKHMIRLVTRRLCCRICQNQRRQPPSSSSAANDSLDSAEDTGHYYHSKGSLLLHNLWRHGPRSNPVVQCRQCKRQFYQRYKLILHQQLVHRGQKRRSASLSPQKSDHRRQSQTTGGKKVKKQKQRKRKSKSRSFKKTRK